MIGEVLVLLRDHLNGHLSVKSGWMPGEPSEDKVVLLDGEKTDPVTFKLGAVTGLLINVEQEHTLRPGDPYKRIQNNGAGVSVQPEIRLNLYVLFIANFKQYEQGLNYLSFIIQYFQNHRVFDHHNAPRLSDRIERLIIEMVTLPLSQQNEVWSALRTSYRPSILYRVRMLVFAEESATGVAGIEEEAIRIHQQ